MTLAEALRIIQGAPKQAPGYPVSLITGNTPEPLSHFLAAHLQERVPDRLVQVNSGRFGDLAGNLSRYLQQGEAPGALLLEWADLDSRLGVRDGGRWGRAAAADILDSIRLRLAHLASLLDEHPAGNALVVVGPTVPLPPVLPVPRWQMSALEAGLASLMAGFLAKAVELSRVRVLSGRRWASIPDTERLDLKSWWMAGAPYRRPFASVLAESIAAALTAPARLKGIITDLDNTLWAGILGDLGPREVHWDLEHHAALHGVYQQFLRSLADDGVLVAIASKNDLALVEEALKRPDLRLSPASIFPVEAHWQPKAESAARILKAWNIGPDSVMFLDDSPLEVALMRAAFPTMDCREFPVEDPDAFGKLLEELAERFGQSEARTEDALRLDSLRSGVERERMLESGHSAEDLLKGSEAELTIERIQDPPDPRALELVNKTNQFNLNGARYSETDWLQSLRSGGMGWIASYRDKFGALGKIAVLAGRRSGARLDVYAWVLSCRAFSRRVEYAILDFLFQEENLSEVTLHFEPTERNTPLREFLAAATGGEPKRGEVRIAREDFAAMRPELYASVLVSR
jgi:FkbH-like protein